MGADRSSPVARLSGIEKRFGDKRVLAGVDLEIRRGEIVALMGPSGCGKTTVLRILSGLLHPDGGLIEIMGGEVDFSRADESVRQVRRRMGIMFQGGALFDSLSVGENVAFPLRHVLGRRDDRGIRAEVEEWLARVGLDGAFRLSPEELSGGMRKRAALARALIHGPDLLLLDEPTTGLDPTTSRMIDRLVRDLVAGTDVAALCVTHDQVSALGIARWICLLEEGVVAWQGRPRDFRDEAGPAVADFLAGSRPIGSEESDGAVRASTRCPAESLEEPLEGGAPTVRREKRGPEMKENVPECGERERMSSKAPEGREPNE
jgi:phospholipid/cholesterol/gamma-HCH transport system ATP-binding protein